MGGGGGATLPLALRRLASRGSVDVRVFDGGQTASGHIAANVCGEGDGEGEEHKRRWREW